MKRAHGDHDDGPVVVPFPMSGSVESQAARWLAALDADEVSSATLDAFRRWINADARHRSAFEELIEFWDDLNILTRLAPPSLNGTTSQRTRKGAPWGWCSAFATLLLVALALLLHWSGDTPPLQFATAVGEQRTITLPDQSIAILNTDSQIALAFDEARRGVRLTRGEVLFDVQKDGQRPFEVYVGDRTVRAIGTAFSVRLDSTAVEVIVAEGVVEVDHVPPAALARKKADHSVVTAGGNARGPSGTRVRLSAGRQAIFDVGSSREILIAEIDKVEEKLSWRAGMLTFDREPLQHVVSEISRYTGTRFVIPDRRVRELVVGGVFRVGDTESLLEALALGFGVEAKQMENDVISLGFADEQE